MFEMPKKETKIENNCGTCSKSTGDENWLGCEVCDKWFHAKCQAITSDVHKIITDTPTCHWYCKQCNVKIGKLIPGLCKLNERCDLLEKELEKSKKELSKQMEKSTSDTQRTINGLQKDFESLEIKVLKIEQDINRQLEENKPEKLEVKWSDIVKKMDNDIQSVSSTLRETKQNAIEERDRENRRNNIVIHRIPESDFPKLEERNKADVDFCLQLFNNAMNVGVTEEDFKGVFRLGKRGDQSRALLVQFNSHNIKNLIMESLYKMKGASTRYRSVVIQHDMTKSEREECRNLVTEAKTRTSADDSGEWIYKVRGSPGNLKIVKFRKSASYQNAAISETG